MDYTDDQWTRIRELLDAAWDLDPDERAAFLDEECADEPGIREEVERLLQAEEEAPEFLEQGAASFAREAYAESAASDAEFEGRQIGPYRLVERLGRGGMSVVYRAERADGQFEQEVAIKLLPRHFETERRVARFHAERQILADLDHPNIARLLDGGVTEEGQPYLAMEHVDGAPITEHCAERQCSLEERLGLLRTVSEALHHAHQNLVVHRDLKPANILVTPDGTVKLLDFGIAKLLSEEDRPYARPLTRTGERPMTPEYAAPEQVTGDAVTTATDIYQLGVLAYELLTGTRPFQIETRSLSEIERAIVGTDPTKPSTAVTEDPSSDETASHQLPSSTGQWRRQLQGDLDTIVLKALRKEPERRYASAEAFAEDLNRYLSEQPVKARPATWRYRFRKFARRHRWGVAGAAAAVALIAVFAVALINQRSVALEERDEAQLQAEKAEEAVRFMTDLFESNDPFQENGETVTARELLERGEERIGELRDRPAIQAELLGAMGSAHRGLGNYGVADSLLREALERSRETLGERHSTTAALLGKLGCALRYQGQYAAADSITRKALAIRQEELGERHPSTAATLNNLGLVLRNQGRYAAADSVYRKALSIRQKELGERHPRTATTLNNLGLVLRNKGQYATADSVLRRALAIRREALGEQHPRVATTLNNLGLVLRNQSKYVAADSVYREALAIRREALGEQHPRVATTLNNLGVMLRSQGQYAAADSVTREALSIRRDALGERHPRTATTLHNLGVVLKNQDQYVTADSMLREALAIEQETLGERHPTTAITLDNIGRVLSNQGRHAAADSVYREALAIRREELSEAHPRTAETLSLLADVRVQQNRTEAADSLYREALSVAEETLDAGDWRIAQTQKKLGTFLIEQGRYAEAESHLTDGFDVLEAERGADDDLTQEAARHLVQAYEAMERPEEAVALSDRILAEE